MHPTMPLHKIFAFRIVSLAGNRKYCIIEVFTKRISKCFSQTRAICAFNLPKSSSISAACDPSERPSCRSRTSVWGVLVVLQGFLLLRRVSGMLNTFTCLAALDFESLVTFTFKLSSFEFGEALLDFNFTQTTTWAILGQKRIFYRIQRSFSRLYLGDALNSLTGEFRVQTTYALMKEDTLVVPRKVLKMTPCALKTFQGLYLSTAIMSRGQATFNTFLT